MQKRAPRPAEIAVMLVFALSCFGLFLYLWSAFGGPIPLRPAGYQVEVAFPEATSLALEADVRVAGVPVGKVGAKRVDPATGRTVARLELEERFAPLAADARAILRQKTLLGETFVELTPGTKGARRLQDGERLADGQVSDTVQLDEIFDALDEPTRAAFGRWQQDFGAALHERGRDLNEALGSLPQLTAEGGDLLRVLDGQRGAVQGLVRDTGAVFEAVGDQGQRLQSLVRTADQVFAATGARQRELASAVERFPRFLRETRETLAATERLAARADSTVRELEPALAVLAPALTEAGKAAPDVQELAGTLDPVISAARHGLPAAAEVLDDLRPTLGALGPFLSELNPILEWLEYNQRLVMAFFFGPAGVADVTAAQSDQEIGHYLRSLAPAGLESIALWPDRLPTHRGNAYLPPNARGLQKAAEQMIVQSWDCLNTGRGEFKTSAGPTDPPSCWTGGFEGWEERPGVFPRIERADYSRPR